jgi:hypothetical protein
MTTGRINQISIVSFLGLEGPLRGPLPKEGLLIDDRVLCVFVFALRASLQVALYSVASQKGFCFCCSMLTSFPYG